VKVTGSSSSRPLRRLHHDNGCSGSKTGCGPPDHDAIPVSRTVPGWNMRINNAA